MTHEEKYTVILDVLAEKIKSQESELNLKKWQVENLEKKLKEAEETIANKREEMKALIADIAAEKAAKNAEECEG